ncbi:hypothetical protein COOONC_00771 [Cooperia oncophora]
MTAAEPGQVRRFMSLHKDTLLGTSLPEHIPACKNTPNVSSEFIVEGCYHCAGGALAKVRCTSATEIFGEVLCTEHAFVIPCAPHGPEPELPDSARQILNYTNYGVLKYVYTFHYPGMTTLDVNNAVFNEFQWPDFGHIIDTTTTWYKTFLIALVAIALAVALTYLYVSTFDMRTAQALLRFLCAVICLPPRLVLATVSAIVKFKFQV